MRCDACPARDLPECLGELAPILCALAVSKPAYRALIVRHSDPAAFAAGPVAPAAAHDAAPITAPWWGAVGACGHRSGEWCCNGEVRSICALNLGIGGIVERHDCEPCPDAQNVQR